jgi:hypothetical protein
MPRLATIKKGSKGNAVRFVQELLKDFATPARGVIFLAGRCQRGRIEPQPSSVRHDLHRLESCASRDAGPLELVGRGNHQTSHICCGLWRVCKVVVTSIAHVDHVRQQ